jgi:hypothetical protein
VGVPALGRNLAEKILSLWPVCIDVESFIGYGEVDELATEEESGVQIHILAVSLLMIV